MQAHPGARDSRAVSAEEVPTMNASSLDSRLCGCRTHGGSEARQVAIESHRQTFIRRTLNPDDSLRHRFVASDALSTAILAGRERLRVDRAGGAG